MRTITIVFITLATLLSTTYSLPVLDSDLAASPFIHEHGRSTRKIGKKIKQKKI
jgi:hypothetical protein